jgi:parvulin-like peptidyl-prolyl isomerase
LEAIVRIAIVPLIAVAGILAAVAAPQSQSAPATQPAQGGKSMPAAAEPEHIKIQHILIGYSGSVPGKPIKRTLDEAKALAYDLLKRAKAGEDFAALVKANTDDAFPGIYGMANRGVAPRQGEYPRTQMVPAFGDAGFPLKVGEIGMADFDPQKSPYGWHIVKRLE